MTHDEAKKTVFPALRQRAVEAVMTVTWADVATENGFADLDVNVSIGDWDQVEHRYGHEVADALFPGER